MLKELHGEQVRTEADFHAAIAALLNLPGHYGANLDALWDVLSADVERPITLVWRSSDVSRAAMGERFELILDVLRRVERQDTEWGLTERFVVHLP